MSPADLRARAPLLGQLALLVAALAALQAGSQEPGLLYLAPAVLLLAALAFDRYPGERLLAAVARGWRPAPHREGRAPARPATPPRLVPRGGVLLALALAGRGPPG